MVSSLDPSFASAQTIPPNTRYHHNSHNMAYNKSYDPDALPRFAEPEPKPGAAAAHHHQQQQQQPPRFDQQHHTLQHHPTQPPPNHQQQYQPSRHNSVPQNPKYDHHQYQQQQQQQQYQQQQQQLHHQQQRAHGARTPVQSHAMYATSPPQSATGHQPAPPSRPATSRPPPSPQQDTAGADPALMPLFRAVDKDGTGYLSERELSVALVNGDWTAFDIQTVRMMIRMFDSDRDGTVGFPEFCGIWSFLGSWRTLFDRFDVDRSGNISLREFSDALVAFRYRLSPAFVELIFRTYDKRGEGVMSFDLFVQACISLKRMTDVFKKYDGDRDGYITLSFEDFLSEILKQLK